MTEGKNCQVDEWVGVSGYQAMYEVRQGPMRVTARLFDKGLSYQHLA